MTETHIRRTFDAQLAAVHGVVVRLGEMVADAVQEATRTLLEHDLGAARVLIEGDDVFDAMTLDIEERCFALLGLQGPMASDLRAVVSALRIASELERCGDLATNIAKTARRLYDAELTPKLRGMIARMGGLAGEQLRFAVSAYEAADDARAAALDDLDDEIDALQRDFLEAVFEWQSTGVSDPRSSVQLALLGRYYERIGDHAVNLGERVLFQTSGWTPEIDGANRARARHHETFDLLAERPTTIDRGVVVSAASERRRVEALRRDFVANIGHELRTPVGALVVLAETLQIEVEALGAEVDAATVRRLAGRVVHEAGRLGHTVDDLLELSRIEAGESLHPVTIPAGELLDTAEQRTRAAAEMAGVTIETHCHPEDLSVVADRRQLVSALTNLIDNAIKYSPNGGRVEVVAKSGTGSVVFEVRDQGIGIPEADHVRIFERFHRVDRARRRDTGGTGLGLAIVRHVALNHGGTIEVSSHEGEGATFTLTVPCRADGSASEQSGRTS